MLEVFPKPPMLAFRQPPNLGRTLCRAKLPPTQIKNKRRLIGVKPCNQPCSICPYVKLSKEFKSTHTKEVFLMNGQYNCSSKGIIYLTTCTQCKKQYVGQSGRQLKERVKEHLLNIYHKKEVSGIHYSLPGHTHCNLSVQVIEQVTPNTPSYRLEREEHWIKKLATKNPFGLNKND